MYEVCAHSSWYGGGMSSSGYGGGGSTDKYGVNGSSTYFGKGAVGINGFGVESGGRVTV